MPGEQLKAAPMAAEPLCQAVPRETAVTHRRAGFTLVELMVVIFIIGLLSAIILPTVMRARATAIDAKVKAEIDMLHSALMNYKNEYGSFPPAHFAGLWDTANGRVNERHPVYRHLVRIYPRLDELKTSTSSPYFYMSQLSPAQALVFWLRGFYPNQEYPLTNGGDPGTRNKLYDFDQARLYAASVYILGSPQSFKSPNAATPIEREFPVYFSANSNAGTPYLYFDSRCYDSGNAANLNDVWYPVTNTNGDTSVARPYFTSTWPLNPLWSQRHVMPESFQLIASGADGVFGQEFVPGAAPIFISYPDTTTFPDLSNVPFFSPDDPANAKPHADNITNFADKDLASSAEKLLEK